VLLRANILNIIGYWKKSRSVFVFALFIAAIPSSANRYSLSRSIVCSATQSHVYPTLLL